MPYVHIKLGAGDVPVSKEQKAVLIKGVTDLLEKELKKPASSTYVTIEEIHPDNWGVGGESLTVRRAKTPKK
jgi:4-oxalocrotonate tautomerase